MAELHETHHGCHMIEVITVNLPRIAESLERIAAALEAQGERAAQAPQDALEEVQRDLLTAMIERYTPQMLDKPYGCRCQSVDADSGQTIPGPEAARGVPS